MHKLDKPPNTIRVTSYKVVYKGHLITKPSLYMLSDKTTKPIQTYFAERLEAPSTKLLERN